MFNKIHVQGDLNKFDFIIYYAFGDDVIKSCINTLIIHNSKIV